MRERSGARVESRASVRGVGGVRLHGNRSMTVSGDVMSQPVGWQRVVTWQSCVGPELNYFPRGLCLPTPVHALTAPLSVPLSPQAVAHLECRMCTPFHYSDRALIPMQLAPTRCSYSVPDPHGRSPAHVRDPNPTPIR